jgi:hypothetical protein
LNVLKKLIAYVAAAFAVTMVPAAAQAVVVKLSYDGTLAGTANGYSFDTGVKVDGLINLDTLPSVPVVDVTNVKADVPAFGITDFALPDLQFALAGFSGSIVGVFVGVNNNPLALFLLDASTIATNGSSFVSIQGGLAQAVPFTLQGINFQLTGGQGTFTLSAVPEAATWAMMILGFGVVGGTLRRRSNRAVLA